MGNTFQFLAPPVTQTNPKKRVPGKVRARWSNEARYNPIMKKPNTIISRRIIHSSFLIIVNCNNLVRTFGIRECSYLLHYPNMIPKRHQQKIMHIIIQQIQGMEGM